MHTCPDAGKLGVGICCAAHTQPEIDDCHSGRAPQLPTCKANPFPCSSQDSNLFISALSVRTSDGHLSNCKSLLSLDICSWSLQDLTGQGVCNLLWSAAILQVFLAMLDLQIPRIDPSRSFASCATRKEPCLPSIMQNRCAFWYTEAKVIFFCCCQAWKVGISYWSQYRAVYMQSSQENCFGHCMQQFTKTQCRSLQIICLIYIANSCSVFKGKPMSTTMTMDDNNHTISLQQILADHHRV